MVPSFRLLETGEILRLGIAKVQKHACMKFSVLPPKCLPSLGKAEKDLIPVSVGWEWSFILDFLLCWTSQYLLSEELGSFVPLAVIRHSND